LCKSKKFSNSSHGTIYVFLFNVFLSFWILSFCWGFFSIFHRWGWGAPPMSLLKCIAGSKPGKRRRNHYIMIFFGYSNSYWWKKIHCAKEIMCRANYVYFHVFKGT
jgi:hypothetical protein